MSELYDHAFVHLPDGRKMTVTELIAQREQLLAACKNIKIYCDGVAVGCQQHPALLFELYHAMAAAIQRAEGIPVLGAESGEGD